MNESHLVNWYGHKASFNLTSSLLFCNCCVGGSGITAAERVITREGVILDQIGRGVMEK